MGERIGVMGGTFDPIHHGHLVAASEVAALYDLAEVIFVPTGQPWQKTEREVSSAEDRYLMTVLATATNPTFSVSRIDIDRPGLTYTIDTLRELARRAARTRSCSSSPVLTRWPRSWTGIRPPELFSMAHFVGVSRPGYELALDERFPGGIGQPGGGPGADDLVVGLPGPGRRAGRRSGISCRTPSSATSTSAGSTASEAAPGRNVPPWFQGSIPTNLPFRTDGVACARCPRRRRARHGRGAGRSRQARHRRHRPRRR